MTHDHVMFIADPIHKVIGITKLEKAVIDSPIFQRLRRIKQLGNVHLLFPGAVHSRFSHSIGVMHVASLLFEAMTRALYSRENNDSLKATLSEIQKVIRLAGLLHDVGHGPLCHHFESCLKIRDNDNEQFRRITYDEWQSELKIPEKWVKPEKLNAFNKAKLEHEHFSYGLIKTLGSLFEFDPQDICSLLCDAIEPSEKFISQLGELAGAFNVSSVDAKDSLKACLKSILSGEIDADRIDYLLRDSYFCGSSTAAIDLPHLMSSITLKCYGERFAIQLNASAVPVVENILISRKQMFNQVYYHRLNGSFDLLLDNVINHLLADGSIKVPTTTREFIALTDETVERQVSDLITDTDIKAAPTDLADPHGLADVCAKFFATRTPLVRMDSRVVKLGERDEILLDLRARYGEEAIIWPQESKKFYGKERYEASVKETLLVAPANQTGNPRSLREYSDVLASNVWQFDSVRIIVFRSYKDSAQERGLKDKLNLVTSVDNSDAKSNASNS